MCANNVISKHSLKNLERRIQFMNAVLHFESMSDTHKLTDFLDYQKLLTNVDELDGTTEQLTLMTLHAAKGTEFPIVIIIGMEEGVSRCGGRI